ncbi:MAG: hypothetical protein AB7U59_08780 [Desulfovibrionaceae bacterium]
MSPADRPTVVSRRNLVRALLGRNIPPSGENARQPQADPHAPGDAAFIAGDFAGAVTAYRTSVRGDLSNVAVRTRLGQALFLTGQFIQARVEFEHALRLTDGQDPMARIGLCLCLLELGKTAKAAVTLAAFADPERPELEAQARDLAAALEADQAPATATGALLALAQATGLFPESA